MKLYYHPASTFSHKVLLALYEKGLDFQPEFVNLFDPAANATYRKRYPIGKIPLLELEDGYLIPESSIIIEYLEGLATEPRLIPQDPEAARKVRFIDRMADHYLTSQVGPLVFESWKPAPQRDQTKIESATRLAGICLDHLEQQLEASPWVCGDRISMADCAVIPALLHVEQVMPFEHYPNLQAYFQRARERPSYRRVLEDAVPALQAVKSAMTA